MQGIIHEDESIWIFILVTIAMGGWLAWMTGRAIALTWRPPHMVVIAMLGLACAVRFIHFALFQGTLIEPHYYLVDLVYLLIVGFAGYRYTRVAQMTTQYRWLYERAGPFSWRERSSP
ncbi:DUF6867 family protein [Terrarubrum flagellatum]|uniref:DUF6867 family protein n=1 Tax=Terrirubrum flagellatum TaxID=2895980 RepID=UPI003144E32D